MSRAAAAGRTAAPFAHLHVASAFSAHYGVSWPEDLVAAAAAADMDLLACTDRDGLYGMAKHVGACLRHGITPIVGVDLAVRWSEDEDAGRVVVLARGGCHGSGYRSLCELVSAAHAPLPPSRRSPRGSSPIPPAIGPSMRPPVRCGRRCKRRSSF